VPRSAAERSLSTDASEAGCGTPAPTLRSELARLARRAAAHVREGGAQRAFGKGLSKLGVYVTYQLRRSQAGIFTMDGRPFNYFHHPYNATWRNERAIEIPLARQFLASVSGPGLEVGNVLAHYGPVAHTVLDKYERSFRVLNVDVVDHEPDERYGWGLAISTLEHVGWDEDPREPEKAIRAIAHLRSLLRADGRLLVTCPLGHNPGLDRAIQGRTIMPSHEAFFSRQNHRAPFRQVDRATAIATITPSDGPTRILWVAEFAPT